MSGWINLKVHLLWYGYDEINYKGGQPNKMIISLENYNFRDLDVQKKPRYPTIKDDWGYLIISQYISTIIWDKSLGWFLESINNADTKIQCDILLSFAKGYILYLLYHISNICRGGTY